jgi:hypothetical protein
MVEALLANIDQTKVDLALAGIGLAKEAVPPTIELIKGRFLTKKSVMVQLTASAVFSFYNPIPMEDYYSVFIKKIVENKTDKNKLKLNNQIVSYSINPNVKTYYPLGLSDFGEEILKQDELLSLYAGIDQIRVFMHPEQPKMTPDELIAFIQAFDDFVSNTSESLRIDGKIPLKVTVKHLVFDTSDSQFLQNCIKLKAFGEGVSVYCGNTKVLITYSKIERLLALARILW